MAAPAPPRKRGNRSFSPPPPHRPIRLGSSRRRVGILTVVFGMMLSLFAARLVELQVLRGPDLAQAALGQRIVTQQIPADRGTITDVNGRPLATTIEVRDITADQTLVEDPAATAAVLAPILSMDVEDVQPLLTGDRKFIYVKKATDPRVWRDIQNWRADPANDGKVLQGIFSDRRRVRDYPNGPLASNIIGFTNAEGRGAVGLEAAMDDLLSGEPGEVTYEQANGTEIPSTDPQRTDPTAGTSIKLTIDADLQWAAQHALNQQVKASNADFGTAVVLEIGTGRLLAMAQAPAFDPLKPDLVKPKHWQNLPMTWAMEPGSTAKLMSIAAVLDQGRADPGTHIVVPPTLPRADQNFRDSHPHGTLYLTLAGVLAESSNMGTILAAERLGGKGLYDYLKRFGVGEPSGLDIPGEATGYVPEPKDWSGTTFPTLAFGQGMSMTAVQIANMTATIANDGVPVQPRVIDSYVHPDGTAERTAPVEGERVLSEQTAQTMQKMMQLVLNEGGTAADLKVPGYLVGGKTGTAMRYDEKCGCYSGYTASFVGVAPADDPKVVVGAWIDHPRGGYYGGSIAGPVVERLMTEVLAKQNIPPTGGKRYKYKLNFAPERE